jgi:hypothetical protein
MRPFKLVLFRGLVCTVISERMFGPVQFPREGIAGCRKRAIAPVLVVKGRDYVNNFESAGKASRATIELLLLRVYSSALTTGVFLLVEAGSSKALFSLVGGPAEVGLSCRANRSSHSIKLPWPKVVSDEALKFVEFFGLRRGPSGQDRLHCSL